MSRHELLLWKRISTLNLLVLQKILKHENLGIEREDVVNFINMELQLKHFESLIKEIVCNISINDYDTINAKKQNGRVDTNDLKRVIIEYGCTVIPLPDEAFYKAEVYYIKDDNRLDVYIPLWTKEEGRSDLTLSLSCYDINGIPKVEINDLKVL